jgi:transcriptional regulator with XRE-family HTH domain
MTASPWAVEAGVHPPASITGTDEPMPLSSSAPETGPVRPIPSQPRYPPPDRVVALRRRHRSRGAWYADGGTGHSIGLGYLVLTMREISGLSQSRLAARARSSQPAIARLESGRQVPTVNTLIRVADACGMHLVVGLADPDLDLDDPCMHDLTLLGVLKPSRADHLPDFFVLREPPPWVGEG